MQSPPEVRQCGRGLSHPSDCVGKGKPFPALTPGSGVEQFLMWAHNHLQQRPAFQEHFRSALQGLVLVAASGSLSNEEQRRRPDGARLLLG